MKDAQKPDHASLNTFLGWLKEGKFVIPDFQREFEWEPWDVAALMKSIFLDYYIGSLLLWRGKKENFDALACEPIYGFDGADNSVHIVLDGQQRLTAMYYAFIAPNIRFPRRANRFLYFIRVDRLMVQDHDEAFIYDWGQAPLKLSANQSDQFAQHMFPLAVVGEGGWDLYDWSRGYEEYWRTVASQYPAETSEAANAARHADNAKGFGKQVKEIIEKYQIAYIELDRDLELDKVCDIFTQINSRGIRLDVFDLMNALLKPKGLQLKHLWRQAQSSLDFVDTTRMNVYVLQVMSILAQAYCSPKYLYYLLPGQARMTRAADGSLKPDVLVADVNDFRRRWESAVEALRRAIAVLRQPQEFGAVSGQYLPYVSILPAFAALQTRARSLPAERQLDASRKIRHWYWASVFTNRYSGSVESTAARDYQDVAAWFLDDAVQPGLIDEFQQRFRTLDLRSETRRGTSIYNGVFNLLVVRGARDWVNGFVPLYDELDDHHIVPKDWGRDQEIGTEVDTILNRTPLSADTNRNVIRDRLPNEYLPELMEASGEDRIRETLETHLISHDAFDILLRRPFTVEDFHDFLVERQRTIVQAIEDLLIKNAVELPPRFQMLNEQVEWTELALRSLVDETLAGATEKLPPHILQRIQDRVEVAIRRDPAADSQLATLAGKLEFSDLRELQDIITGKQLWPLFASRFGTKEALGTRFSQLAELRNRLRHSRSLDDVTVKDGEAALLWFGRVMTR